MLNPVLHHLKEIEWFEWKYFQVDAILLHSLLYTFAS